MTFWDVVAQQIQGLPFIVIAVLALFVAIAFGMRWLLTYMANREPVTTQVAMSVGQAYDEVRKAREETETIHSMLVDARKEALVLRGQITIMETSMHRIMLDMSTLLVVRPEYADDLRPVLLVIRQAMSDMAMYSGDTTEQKVGDG